MMYETIVNQPAISGADFDLRPLRLSDRGLIEMYTNDARVAKNTASIPHPLPPGSTDGFIKRALSKDRTEDVWAMDASKSGGSEIMGLIGLTRMDRNQSEVGYWVAPAFWNTGVASLALGMLIGANPQECSGLFASVFQDNPASARVLTKSGFEYLGDAEVFSVARNANVATWTYLKKLD